MRPATALLLLHVHAAASETQAAACRAGLSGDSCAGFCTQRSNRSADQSADLCRLCKCRGCTHCRGPGRRTGKRPPSVASQTARPSHGRPSAGAADVGAVRHWVRWDAFTSRTVLCLSLFAALAIAAHALSGWAVIRVLRRAPPAAPRVVHLSEIGALPREVMQQCIHRYG